MQRVRQCLADWSSDARRNARHLRNRDQRSENTRAFIGGTIRVWQERMELDAEEGMQHDDSP